MANVNRRFVHGSERNHSVIDIVGRPSHPRNIVSPEFLTGASADGIDCLRDELMVEGQRQFPYVKEGIISYVERTGRIAGHSPCEHHFCTTST